MLAADEAILTEVSDIVLDPEVVAGAIQDAIAELRPSRDRVDRKREALLADLRKLDEQQGRFVAAIAQAGEIDALVTALKTRELDRQRVRGPHGRMRGCTSLPAARSSTEFWPESWIPMGRIPLPVPESISSAKASAVFKG